MLNNDTSVIWLYKNGDFFSFFLIRIQIGVLLVQDTGVSISGVAHIC